MSQVSKRVLSKKIQESLFQNFWEIFAQIKKPKEVAIFLEDFLSPTEKVMLAKRLAIAILFSKGYNHRSISSLLKVSIHRYKYSPLINSLIGTSLKSLI